MLPGFRIGTSLLIKSGLFAYLSSGCCPVKSRIEEAAAFRLQKTAQLDVIVLVFKSLSRFKPEPVRGDSMRNCAGFLREFSVRWSWLTHCVHVKFGSVGQTLTKAAGVRHESKRLLGRIAG